MSALGLFTLGAGIFLIWCAIKGENPRDVIKKTLSGT